MRRSVSYCLAAMLFLLAGCNGADETADVATTEPSASESTTTTVPPLTADEAAEAFRAEMERACRAETAPVWEPRWAPSGKTEANLHADVETCILWTMANEYAAAIESACALDSGPVTFDPSWSRTKFTQEGMTAEVEACRAQRRAATPPTSATPRVVPPTSGDDYSLTTYAIEVFWADMDRENRLTFCGTILDRGTGWLISFLQQGDWVFEIDRDAAVTFFDLACAREIREGGE